MTFNYDNDKISSEIINANTDSILYTFKNIFGKEPNLENNSNEKSIEGFSAVIEFTGDTDFNTILSIPKKLAISIAPKFCGFDIDCDSLNMKDMVCELINIVAGNIIKRMSNKNLNVNMSLPTTFSEHDYAQLLSIDLNSEKLYFSMMDGVFVVIVSTAKLGDSFIRKPGN